MTQDARTKFQLSLGEATLEAPETPHYLDVAARLLEARRREIEEEQAPAAVADGLDTGHAPAAPPIAASSPVTAGAAMTPRFPQAPFDGLRVSGPAAPSYQTTPHFPPRRAHWFSDRFPRITLEDGSVQIPRSLEELKGILQARGITPHPRGDASMLLWQVRNRLKMKVETVGSQDS